MKSIYVSPEIMYEDFSLSTNIAGTCESIVGNPTKGTCAVIGTGPDQNIFSSDMVGICFFSPEGMGLEKDKWDGFCYHVPTEAYSLFNS
ncbi:MAG: hypothetical protein IJ356_06615 [Erysipelotrichaceae bacterium]|nr:hypothetical protein [Erysipelotrichaceae bacterium]